MTINIYFISKYFKGLVKKTTISDGFVYVALKHLLEQTLKQGLVNTGLKSQKFHVKYSNTSFFFSFQNKSQLMVHCPALQCKPQLIFKQQDVKIFASILLVKR